MLRVQSDGQLKIADGLLVSLHTRTNKSPQGKCRDMIRSRVCAPIEVQKSFVKAPLLLEQDAGLVGCISVGGIEFDRALKAKKRFAQTPCFEESVAQMPPEIGIVRLELHRPVKDLESLPLSSEP